MTTTIRALVEAVETKLAAAPSLGVTLADDLRGVTSATRRHKGVRVLRPSSTDLGQDRGQDTQRIEDRLQVELAWRLAPKDQRTARSLAYDTEQAIIDRVTDLDDTTLRPLRPRYRSTTETRPGEWLLLVIEFRLRRMAQVGAG